MRIAFCLVAIAISGAYTAGIDLHPLSDAYIDFVNSQQSTWTAGRNFEKNTPMSFIRGLLGVRDYPAVLKDKRYRVQHPSEDVEIPKSFDARENWPECESIKVIRDQSHCGDCWAVASASTMSDRICIHSNGTRQVYVSEEDLLSCCASCGNGCGGGFVMEPWYYWQWNGISSGGLYNSTTGCKAYSLAPCPVSDGERHCTGDIYDTPVCKKECDSGSSFDYDTDKTFGLEPYGVSKEKPIQLEILKNGPVYAVMNIFEDFSSYKSGVYQNLTDTYLGSHVVRMIGWGEEKGTPYWLVANTWSENWGENGFFRIIRGQNECDIENFIFVSLPKL